VLSSFAAISFERPHWSFPEITEEQPSFEAIDLKHPLLSPAKAVGNDLRLDRDVRLLIVSGSNMSGKSTLLRAVGLNAVLAWAGAPVAARTMSLSPLNPAASLRSVDSLQDNRSRFMAEIIRIRQIVDLLRSERPVLFLLDELLSGTNSHDRRIGAAGILKKLVGSGAVGLMTTHDLALTEIETELAPHASNVHFDDQIVSGEVEFDYKLRTGLVTHSNALELMRAVGLEV
jgi:DNA mismatch repair ATPase MutS